MTFPREVTPGKFLGFRHSLPRGLGYEDPGSLQARRFPNAIFLKGNTLFVREMRQKTRYGTFFSLSFNDVLQVARARHVSHAFGPSLSSHVSQAST